MSDIFISYSRKDEAFVKRLVDALDEYQRTYWIDWEDIPWTSDWWKEIKAGIQSQNNFIFVLSENSLTSPVCMLEVEHAIANNKRLIPIVLSQAEHQRTLKILAKLDPDAGVRRILQDKDLVKLSEYNWQFLARHNWLFFNDSDKFTQSFAHLLEAIDTDLDHVHTHTRLLIRATEWQQNNRNSDDLLAGDAISEAETWLGSSGGKDPIPTQLITEYIFASRKRATNIQRRLLTGVSVALLVTVILGILSVILWQQAEAERVRADRRAHESESGRIAVQALLEGNDAVYDRALLLSLEALVVDDNREARSSLASTLQEIPKLTTFLYEHDSWIRDVVHTPDGDQFITTDDSGQIIFWDTATNMPDGDPILGAESGIWSLAHHSTNALLASAGNDGVIRLWDTSSRELETSFATDDNSVVYSLAFHPDGDILASAHADSFIYLWDITTGEVIATLKGHTDWVSILDFSHDGMQLASGGRDARVLLWDTSDILEPTLIQEIVRHTNWVLALDFNLDGTILATGGADGTVRLWNTETAEALGQPLTDHRGWVREIVFSPDGSMLMTTGQDQTIILRDPRNGRRLRGEIPLVGHSEEIFALSPHPIDTTIVTADQNGDVLVWDSGIVQPFAEDIYQSTGSVLGLGITADGILSIADAGTIQITDNSGDPLHDAIQEESIPITVATTATDGSHYAYSVNGEIITATIDHDATILGNHDEFVMALAYNADSTQLASGSDDGVIKLWDIATGEQVEGDMPLFDARVTALAYSPAGNSLAVGTDDGQITVLDVASQTVSTTYPLIHTDDVVALTFNADGTILASGSYDQSVILWDVETGDAIGQSMQEHSNWVLGLAFSPDDATLASVSRDESLILWDVATQRPIGQPFTTSHGWLWRVAFESDGQSLLTGSRDGTVQRWVIDLDDWVARACQIANRQLDETERDIYLSELSENAVCN